MKIGLALSGGGALGVAHIGAIEEIKKAGIKIDYICGVSSGAISGLAYAAGGIDGLHRFYDDTLVRFTKSRFLFAKGPNAAFKYIESVLIELCAGKNFDELGVSFSCCATNLATGQAEMINSGNPFEAVMASSAYPGVFAPQILNDKIYVDGGVTTNVPVAAVRQMGADFVIGSSIYGINMIDKKNAAKMNRLEVLMRSLDVFQKELSFFEEKQCDFCFKPQVAQFHWFDFFKMEEILETGRQNAALEIKKLLSLLK